jgi:aldehyde:ferredoxin oxidoreductase
LFNVREGISRKDDKVPERYHEPLKYGPYKGEYIDEQKFKDMLDEYYEMSGLDKEGKPKPESLKRLQLDDGAFRTWRQFGAHGRNCQCLICPIL